MNNIKLKLSLDSLYTRHQCVEWFGFLEYGQYGLRADYIKVINADGASYVIHDLARNMRPHGFGKQLIGRQQDSYKGALSMMSLNCDYSGIRWVNPISSFDADGVHFNDMSATLDRISNEVCLEGVALDCFGQCRIIIADEDMLLAISALRKQSYQSPCIDTRSIAKGLGEHFGAIQSKEAVREERRKTMELHHENLELKERIRMMSQQPSTDSSVKYRPIPSADMRKVYIMKDSHNGLYKIGRSVNPKSREKTLQSEKPSIAMVFHADETEKMNEKTLHIEFAEQRVRGEWFSLTPAQVRYICSRG